MHKSTALVSAIIPVYNGETFIGEAIESVLAQSHRSIEIIVVDDGSTDKTAQIVKRFGDLILYRFQPNRGAPAARNKGLKIASGEFISFLDADDIWTPTKLNIQLNCFMKNPSTEIVLGRRQQMIDKNGELQLLPEVEKSFNLACCLFRQAIFTKFGSFDETLLRTDDWDWFMRAKENGVKLLTHKDVVFIYRRHGNNMTNQVDIGNYYTLQMIKKSLNRRRQADGKTARPLPALSDFKECME